MPGAATYRFELVRCHAHEAPGLEETAETAKNVGVQVGKIAISFAVAGRPSRGWAPSALSPWPRRQESVSGPAVAGPRKASEEYFLQFISMCRPLN